MYADIAACLPLARTFVYRVNEPVEPGCRVVVPFRKREVEGFVVGFRKDAPADMEVHEIGSVLDAIPLLRADIFRLCRWIGLLRHAYRGGAQGGAAAGDQRERSGEIEAFPS